MRAKVSAVEVEESRRGRRDFNFCRVVCCETITPCYDFLSRQGVGNPQGSSLVVRYQHDINYLRDMAKFTLDHYGM